MWWMCSLALGGSGDWIADRIDARYAWQTGRMDDAAAWYRARLDEAPDDRNALLDYLSSLGYQPDQRNAALPGLVEAHLQAHPSPNGPAARAIARTMSSMRDGVWTTGLFHGHAWCDEALAVLADRPIAPDGSDYRVARTALEIARHCGRPTEPFEQLAGDAARASAEPSLRAWWGRHDGFDETDLADLETALTATPHVMGSFRFVFHEEAAGPAVGPARARLVDTARAHAAHDRPVLVWEAIQVLVAADLPDEAWAARQHLADIDPGNRSNHWALLRGPTPPEPSREVEPSTVLDPAARLEALEAQGRPADRFDRAVWWAAWAEASHAVGDDAGWLRGLRHGSDPEAFAEAALSVGEELGLAHRRVNRLVRQRRRVRVGRGDPTKVGVDWRERLARALELQARLYEARGLSPAAHAAIGEALLLAPPTPERLVLAGLTSDRDGPRAIDWLARGLAELPEDHPLTEPAWARLELALAAQGTWTAGSPLTFVDAMAREPVPSEDPGPDPLPVSPRLANLDVRVDGRPARLLDAEGPIVVDVWATWCGPCKESLPHFDALAREYGDRVTMIALSVDEERAVAEAYLEERGEPSFVSAWAGKPGIEALASGIPAYLVFDDEHRLVARLSGWSPGDRRLDRAIERMLAR